MQPPLRSDAQAEKFFRSEDVFGRNAAAAEADAFGFQPQALLESRFSAQPDLAARAQHAMPREAVSPPAQQLDDQPVVQWIARGGGDCGIGGDAPARDAADDIENRLVARGVLAPQGAAQRAFKLRVAALHTPQQ